MKLKNKNATISGLSAFTVLVIFCINIGGITHFLNLFITGLIYFIPISIIASFIGYFQQGEKYILPVICGAITGLIGGFAIVFMVASNI